MRVGRQFSTELSPGRHRRWPPNPSQRSGVCSTIIEKKKVSCSRQHPSRAGPSRWRRCNHRSHDNLPQDLADRRMANPVDPVLNHHTSQERQPAAMPELPNNKPHQSPKQSHAEDDTEQIEASSGIRSSLKNRRTSEQEGAPQSKYSNYESSVRNISSTSKTSTISS